MLHQSANACAYQQQNEMMLIIVNRRWMTHSSQLRMVSINSQMTQEVLKKMVPQF